MGDQNWESEWGWEWGLAWEWEWEWENSNTNNLNVVMLILRQASMIKNLIETVDVFSVLNERGIFGHWSSFREAPCVQ